MGPWHNRLRTGSHEDGLGVGAWVILGGHTKVQQHVGRITAWNWTAKSNLTIQVDAWEGQWRQSPATSGWAIWEEGRGTKHVPGTWPSITASGPAQWFSSQIVRRIWAGEAGVGIEEGSRRRRELWVRLDGQGMPLTTGGVMQAPSEPMPAELGLRPNPTRTASRVV